MAAWHPARNGSVVLLTLTLPPINALDREALEELAVIIENVESDTETRALIITGGVEGIFCTGGDLKYWRNIDDANAVSGAGRKVLEHLQALKVPTVAAINGRVIGDGLALALACDLRVAADCATFRLPEIAYGFIPGWGTIGWLVDAVGRACAADVLLTGKPISGPRAQQIGLVHYAVASEDLMRHALKLGAELATGSRDAIAAAKCALRGGDEGACFARVWGGADRREGMDALIAKRKPVFEQGGSQHDLAR